MAAIPVNVLDRVDQFSLITYVQGPYYSSGNLSGTITVRHVGTDPDKPESGSRFYVKIYNSNHVLKKQVSLFGRVQTVPFDGSVTEVINWSIALSNVLNDGQDEVYFYVKFEKLTDSSVNLSGDWLILSKTLSSEKNITSFYFNKSGNLDYWLTGTPSNIIATINQNTSIINFNYPEGMDLTDLDPIIGISKYATVSTASHVHRDFSTRAPFIVTAENGTTKQYFVDGTVVPAAYIFIYDNVYTRVIPLEIERGESLEWYVLISNSGTIPNDGTQVLTVTIEDDSGTYYYLIFSGVIGEINSYVDKEMNGSFVIPSDFPIGSDIKFYVSFHLSNSLIKRYITISNWDESAKGIVYNKAIQAFVRETKTKSKFFSRINNDFYTLKVSEDANTFYYHDDTIADGEIRIYENEFSPSITFVVNKFGIEKIFDNIMMQLNNVGVTRIDYETETQTATHIWPTDPLEQDQLRPWIDPEFREDKWYLPVHNEEINGSGTGDLVETREMRGTWMKIKITFKPLFKFTLKNVITEFRQSNI